MAPGSPPVPRPLPATSSWFPFGADGFGLGHASPPFSPSCWCFGVDLCRFGVSLFFLGWHPSRLGWRRGNLGVTELGAAERALIPAPGPVAALQALLGHSRDIGPGILTVPGVALQGQDPAPGLLVGWAPHLPVLPVAPSAPSSLLQAPAARPRKHICPKTGCFCPRNQAGSSSSTRREPGPSPQAPSCCPFWLLERSREHFLKLFGWFLVSGGCLHSPSLIRVSLLMMPFKTTLL